MIPPTQSWPTYLASALAAGAAVHAVAVASGRLGTPPAGVRRRGAALVALPLLILAAASGGVASPAVLPLALCVLAVDVAVGPTVALAAVTFASLLALHLTVLGAPSAGAVLACASLLASIGVVPGWLLRRAAGEVAQARRRAAGLETFLTASGTTPPGTRAVPSALRASAAEHMEDLERRRADALSRLLQDVRDAAGADEAVFWRRSRAGDALVASAWSGDGAATEHLRRHDRLPLVAWAAEQRLVHFDDARGTPTLAAAPAGDDPTVGGAISVSASAGLRRPREELRRWLPRWGAHVDQLCELLELREEHARQGQHTKALLEAAHHFQSNRSTDSLGASICETALSMTSGRRAALVRWYAAESRGEVQFVSAGHGIPAWLAVSDDAHVGRMCRNGLPQVWEDARYVDRSVPVYGHGEPARHIGSLGIVPLKRGLDVVGAIVIEGDAPGDVLIRDVRTVRVLAALAALSLETVWEIEEVSRRAHTDQLTGLANRRSFDESLARVLAETDRFGGSASLILVDLDHFKQVNDTHGHTAGDRVLKVVAAALQEGVRTVDICARFGGEELAILLPQTPLVGAAELAERCRKSVEQRLIAHEGTSIGVTASFGVAAYPDSATTREGLLPAADRALYRAKHEGRNRVCSAPASSSPRSR